MKKLFVLLFGICVVAMAGEAIVAEKVAAHFVQAEVNGVSVRFCDVRKAPFILTGFPFCQGEEQPLRRLPADMTKADVNAGALSQAQCLSGGAVLFRTDSTVLAIRVTGSNLKRSMDRMPASGLYGYDLYERCPDGTERFINNTRVKDGAARIGGRLRKGMADYILYLPLYSGVDSLEIGVSPEASFETPTPQRLQKPIVFYGSSITQGGCASRPANNYTTMICRALDAPQINLGFSGSAQGEPAVARAIATLDASLLVLDYDHNASIQHLATSHEPFFKIIRAARPDLPVIFISRPDAIDGGVEARRAIIRKTYDNAVAAGDKNVYFIDGEKLFGPGGQNFCTVDGTHPNDLGFFRMYEGVLPVVKQALRIDE